MAVSTTTTLDAVIAEVYNKGRVADITFINDYMVQLPGLPDEGGQEKKPKGLFPIIPSRGGSAYRWTVQTAGPTAREYDEGQAPPAPTGNTYVEASIAYSTGYFDVALELTGHAIDALKDEGAIVEEVDKILVDGFRSMQDAINNKALGSTDWGLQLAIDSSGTYAGLARGTYTTWVAGETALSAALSRSALRDGIEYLTDNDVGARHQDLILLMPVNQVSNYHGLGISTSHPVVMNTQGGAALDLGFTGEYFEGLPIYGIPDLTDTVVMILDRTKVYWVMHRPPTIEKKQTAGDSVAWYLTCSMILVMEDCTHGYKLTGVTA